MPDAEELRQPWQGPQDIVLPDIILGRENKRGISSPDFVNIQICDMRGGGGGGLCFISII